MKNQIKIRPDQVDIRVSEVVLYNDYECADMGNPSGAVHGFISRIRLTLDDGTCYLHNHIEEGHRSNREAEVAELSEKLLLKVQERGVVNLDHWSETEARYGSQAWERQDAERNYQFQVAAARGDIAEMERWG